jgi:hypothetical protein
MLFVARETDPSDSFCNAQKRVVSPPVQSVSPGFGALSGRTIIESNLSIRTCRLSFDPNRRASSQAVPSLRGVIVVVFTLSVTVKTVVFRLTQ